MPISDLYRLWGKSNEKGSPDYHPLLFHLLDVGMVGKVILENNPPLQKRFALTLGVDNSEVSSLVSYLLAIHDLGKASPGFQTKVSNLWEPLVALGLKPKPGSAGAFDHGREAYLVLADYLRERLHGLPDNRIGDKALDSLALGIAAHHGRFYRKDGGKLENLPDVCFKNSEEREEEWDVRWRKLRRELLDAMKEIFHAGDWPKAMKPGNLSSLCLSLNGFCILCDWIASDVRFFEPTSVQPLADYADLSRRNAEIALKDRGFFQFLPPVADPSYAALFPKLLPARPLQRAIETASFPERPLIIIEAPMGEGKTEAALLAVMRLASEGKASGFYFALPTVATSDQMYGRIREFLGPLMNGEAVYAHLINGRAEFSPWVEEALEKMRKDAYPDESSEQSPIRLDPWLMPRKRSLLAPYGVGTIDQALLCGLNVKHVGLRMLGLAGKVVVFDEVHACDAYMSTILKTLLAWLREIGASVILLSATLPRKRRRELVAAFVGVEAAEAEEEVAYPLVTIADAANSAASPAYLRPKPSRPSVILRIDSRAGGDAEIESNASYLLDRIQEGGCACWIRNTVADAQEAYLVAKRLIERSPEIERPDLSLFHARFPLGRRRVIEEDVLGKFGKKSENRPFKALLIATQVVEQSLDLDFDLMMTDFAPADLLLQRAGRLHRHDRSRPRGLEEPLLLLLAPPIGVKGPEFGKSAYVYDEYHLLRSFLALRDKREIALPGDLRKLIEAVYDDDILYSDDELLMAGVPRSILEKAKVELEKQFSNESGEAKFRLLGDPRPDGEFWKSQKLETRDDDDVQPELQYWMNAQTRLADPSVTIILTEEGSDLIRRLESLPARSPEDRRNAVQLDEEERSLIREMILHSVSVQDRRLVQRLKSPLEGVPSLADLPGMKRMRILPLKEDRFHFIDDNKPYRLTCSSEIGVRIEPDGKERE